jgi:hypothetical protein
LAHVRHVTFSLFPVCGKSLSSWLALIVPPTHAHIARYSVCRADVVHAMTTCLTVHLRGGLEEALLFEDRQVWTGLARYARRFMPSRPAKATKTCQRHHFTRVAILPMRTAHLS